MYPFFIEVHDQRGNQLVNIDAITNVYVDPDGITTISTGIGFVDVTETYDEVKALIEGCGCLINKGDPRLDTSRPLTMKDLEEMKSGEPVWNSNRNEWYLLRTMTEDGEVWFSDFVVSKVIATEGMLIKTPLYRMKQ